MLTDFPYRRVPGYQREGEFDRFKRLLFAGKPRISRSGGQWCCMGQSFMGFGVTPWMAQMDWQRQVNRAVGYN